jgi:arylsulfatase A-like enzyme
VENNVMSQPPNVILIHSDQHRFDCLGCNGHPLIRTPNLDRLASEGVNCTAAFTPTPICSPARACLLTGCWPTRHGCLSIPNTELYRPARADLPLLSQVLNRAGYWQGYVGKYHQELAGVPTGFGYDRFIPGGAYRRWRAEAGLSDYPGGSGPFDYFGNTDEGITPEQSQPAWEADRAIEMIESAAGHPDRPFLVRWDPRHPHLPCVPPEPYASMYPPADVPPWESFGDTLENKPYVQAQQRRSWKVDGWTWAQWAPTVAAYLGEISLLDHQIGRILDALDRLGLADDTLVIYTSDHGDLCGGHGMMDKHFVMYDDVMRVPLLLRWPGRLPAGRACDAFISHAIDLPTTLAEAAGAPVPETFAGRDLLALIDGRDVSPRPDVFAQWSGGQFGSYTQRMVRDRRWKYVWNATDRDELYDLAADPGEKCNLAGSSDHADQLARLRHRLVDWMAQIGDVMLNRWTREQLLSGATI